MVGALLVFMGLNSERIVEQNSQYLEVSTSQTARRLNDMFDASLESTRAMASVFEDSLEGPDVNPAEAMDVFTQSQFDQTFFVTTDGVAYNYDGRTADAADRHYYIEGMKAKAAYGASPVFLDISCDLHGIDNGRKLACKKDGERTESSASNRAIDIASIGK